MCYGAQIKFNCLFFIQKRGFGLLQGSVYFALWNKSCAGAFKSFCQV